MRTRANNWLDTSTNKPKFGIQVFVDGKWKNAAENGKPLLFDCLVKREAKRRELRKIRIQETK